MQFFKRTLPVSTTVSAISHAGILPEKDAPVYPYITFINNLSAICRLSIIFFKTSEFPYYNLIINKILFTLTCLRDFFSMILVFKNS